jgi:hypothetical protein
MLSERQRDGQEGRFAEAMSAFIIWIAGRYEQMQSRVREHALEIRNRARFSGSHARLAAALAELQAGWEVFLQFAMEVGAVGNTERQELESRAVRALGQLSVAQVKYQAASDPAEHFLALLRVALAWGFAHVADRRGRAPAQAAVWGWQGQRTGRSWKPQGMRIGWVEGNNLFLEPSISYCVAQEMAAGERLSISAQTLRHRLGQRGLLVSTDAGRQMVLIRRTLEGSPRQVLHLAASALVAP